MSSLETIQKYILYAVSFPKSEYEGDEPRHFSNEKEAQKCANLDIGWYGSKGRSYIQEFNAIDLPKYYNSFEEWAKENLTYNECKKLNVI